MFALFTDFPKFVVVSCKAYTSKATTHIFYDRLLKLEFILSIKKYAV